MLEIIDWNWNYEAFPMLQIHSYKRLLAAYQGTFSLQMSTFQCWCLPFL